MSTNVNGPLPQNAFKNAVYIFLSRQNELKPETRSEGREEKKKIENYTLVLYLLVQSHYRFQTTSVLIVFILLFSLLEIVISSRKVRGYYFMKSKYTHRSLINVETHFNNT